MAAQFVYGSRVGQLVYVRDLDPVVDRGRQGGWPQSRVRVMRHSSLIPSSPSEESVPDTVNASLERSADTVSLRTSALFRDEVEVASRGAEALGRRLGGMRRP